MPRAAGRPRVIFLCLYIVPVFDCFSVFDSGPLAYLGVVFSPQENEGVIVEGEEPEHFEEEEEPFEEPDHLEYQHEDPLPPIQGKPRRARRRAGHVYVLSVCVYV